MVFTKIDNLFMQQAINLAGKGALSVKGNPLVGCVIVRDDSIIAEGYHEESGKAHAEVNAINNAKGKGISLEGVTMYITLEPCSHYGKTPPCVNAILNSKISKVIIGSLDPHPLVQGNGIKKLRSAGISVLVGCLEYECKKLNKGFFKKISKGLPYVISKVAMSLDGRVAMSNGESKWITCSDSRIDVHFLRAKCDVILTGIGTILSDDPQLNVRELPRNAKKMTISQPLICILDARLDIPVHSKVLVGQNHVIIFCIEGLYSKSKYIALKKTGVEVVTFPNNGSTRLDIKDVLKCLVQLKDINYVMVEAGSRVVTNTILRDLVDEIHIYIAPIFMGSSALPVIDINIHSMSDKLECQFKEVANIGSDIKVILKKG